MVQLLKANRRLMTKCRHLLRDLLSIVKVAVISGGNWPQFEKQLVSNLHRDANLENLSLLPTCGTKFYKHGSAWEELYSENFTNEEKAKIIGSLREAMSQALPTAPIPVGGEAINGVLTFPMALLSFVDSTPRAYRLKASNAAPPISTFPGAIPAIATGLLPPLGDGGGDPVAP